MNEQVMENVELNQLVGQRVREQIDKLKEILEKELKVIVWQACNDYVEYSKWEPLENWKDRERYSLIGAKYFEHKDCFWGKTMRAKIFEEYKDVILPMIKDEQIEEMQKKIKELEDRNQFLIDCEKNRYR